MKDKLPAIAFLLGACLVGFALSRPADALDLPLSELKDAVITCSPTVITPILSAAPQGSTRADWMHVSNNSTTCIHVGGAGITATTGLVLGTSCRDGVGIDLPVKRAYCLSASGSLPLDVVYGVR